MVGPLGPVVAAACSAAAFGRTCGAVAAVLAVVFPAAFCTKLATDPLLAPAPVIAAASAPLPAAPLSAAPLAALPLAARALAVGNPVRLGAIASFATQR